MVGYTEQEEWALVVSARSFHETLDIAADPQPDAEWELGLAVEGVTILLNRKCYVAAVVTPYGVDLVNDPALTFLADQIHRCSAGALNGYQPQRTVDIAVNA